MMQKRSLYSLLLTSFMLVCAFSLSHAQSVTFESKTDLLRCQDNTINVTVDNPTDISAFEIVFAVSGDGSFSGVAWDSGLLQLTHRYIDLSNLPVVRIAGMMIDPGDGCLATGQTVVAQVNLLTADVCDGDVTIDEASLIIDKSGTCSINATTQFVECASGLLVPATVNPGTVTIQNAAPTIEAIADISVHWIANIVPIATVTDDGDLHTVPGGCEALIYSIDAPTTDGAGPQISATGLITWHPTGADIGVHEITVTVNDGCGVEASTMFSACVWNLPPTLVCDQEDIFTGWGDLIEGTVTGDTTDGGPSPLLYSVNSFTGTGMVTIDPTNGDWSWQTEFDAAYTGTFTLCIGVTDGAAIVPGCSEENSAECCLDITVVPYLITIEKTHSTIQGQEETVDIFMLDDGYVNYPMGGFDFLIKYDASALILNTVDAGAFILDAGWEYFTYRYGESGNCGSNACPSGIVRIVSIADINNGANHPDFYTNETGISNQLAVMRFLVTDDRTLECQYVPIRWIWYDCGDNAISSVDGNTLFISRYIWEFEGDFGDPASSIHNPAYAFPSLFGANADCDVSGGVDKPEPLRLVDFINGGIDIVCADSIDARGDINLNGIDNEVADAVLFTQYFINGLSAFNEQTVNGQIAATDVNADGIVLSVADLVYLIRVIVGDALPYYKPGTPAKVNYLHADNGLMTVDGAKIGAAFVVAEGEVTPELRADGMEMRYAFDGTNTRILVYSLDANSFTGEFLNVNGNVLSIEMATADGNQVNAKLIPTNFSLAQNYPNPFNPTTSIAFSLPMASDYTLTIFNVSGQTIQTLKGSEQAGNVVLDWDANDLASGIYFYRLDAGSFSDTKKMVLLK